MSSSDLSELTSNVSTDDEALQAPAGRGKLDHYFKHGSVPTQAPPPLKKKRPPSPPHEYVLADNQDVAFICMFRSRFSNAFQKSLPHYGPQDIENGLPGPSPGEQVEKLLCALLGLVLNRKKDIERGHYTRALEEAISSHASQWPSAWQGKNPLHGGGSFNNMTPEQRLTLMKTLIIWSLESSEAVKAIIKDSYKQSRHDDDLNQPLSVQPWGRDGDKRRFWLIEGQDDTHFRLYRESNPALKHVTWRSVAGDIDELKQVANRLGEENTQASRRLRDRITAAIPRFEASEEKRKRRDYRLARRAQFARPEPGFSLYEGRTRGKRIRYNYSDEEGAGSDEVSTRRSNRPSGISSPAEPAGPTYTASGRQVRSRHGGLYGETTISGRHQQGDEGAASGKHAGDGEDADTAIIGRTRGITAPNGEISQGRRKFVDDFGSSEESDVPSNETSSGHEWDGADDDADEGAEDDDDEEDLDMSDDGAPEEDNAADSRQSLVVQLRYTKGTSRSPPARPQTEVTESVIDAYSGPPNENFDAIKINDDSLMVDALPNGLPPAPQQGDRVSNLPSPQPRFSASDPANISSSQGNAAGVPFSAEHQEPSTNPHTYVYSEDPPPSNSKETPSNISTTEQIPPVMAPSNGLPSTMYE